MTDLKLGGIIPPLSTPFDERGDVDTVALAENVASYNGVGFPGYLAFGSTGEAVHLTAAERLRVFETIRKAAAPGRFVIGGVNEQSTRGAVEAARIIAGAGADAVLVITPYFYKGAMTQESLSRHFIAVADAAPVPILIYNIPQNTGVVMEPATVAALAQHPNIVGIKDSAGNMIAISNTISLVPSSFAVFSGNGSILYPALMMGATGGVLGVSCVAPAACVELYEAARRGDHPRARELQNRLSALSQLLTATFGVPGLKAGLDFAGLRGGPPRSPLIPVSDAVREKIRSAMRESGLFPDLG
jgi:4-hydroxy-2-oxoglutarate aldolase